MERDHGHMKQQPPWSCSFSFAGFAWPPPPPQRSHYACGFCKREFSSSQALGGHMNVHRWDRAMLIQCSSLRHLAASLPDPNPGHGLTPSLNLSPPHCAGDDGGSAADKPPVIYSFFSTSCSAATEALEVNLELGVGACSNGDGTEDGLDLDLRLGYS